MPNILERKLRNSSLEENFVIRRVRVGLVLRSRRVDEEFIPRKIPNEANPDRKHLASIARDHIDPHPPIKIELSRDRERYYDGSSPSAPRKVQNGILQHKRREQSDHQELPTANEPSVATGLKNKQPIRGEIEGHCACH